ncbi:hypothetical protein RCN81_01315, partial [Escherichia coli]|nr:hypothetical protein [Escherichia coli]
KYLLCVLLSITSIPAHSSEYIYHFVKGTITSSNHFATDSSSQLSQLNEYGEGRQLRITEYLYKTSTLTKKWSTTSSEFLRYDDAHLRLVIPNTPAFETYKDGPNGGPIDIGEHTFPSGPVTTEYLCKIPTTVSSDRMIDGRVNVDYRLQIGASVPGGWSSMNIRCTGYYELRKHVEITLAKKEITLIGTQPHQLTGTTKMTVKGVGGLVTVEIDNPSLNDVSVSFEQDRIATSWHMNLTEVLQPHEQLIYVRGKTTKPGSHTYTVRLNASFK